MKWFFTFSLSLLLSAGMVAQGYTLQGIVEDATGETLIGVFVYEKGNEVNGTITDFDGNFSIKVPSKSTVVVFTYIGMTTVEGPASSFKGKIIMEDNTSVLDQVVVMGYGTKKRSNISGAVATLSSDDISDLPILRAEQALQGQTAGVQVTQNSGSPGAALSVKIRGTGTINNSDPLYIVDGIPVGGIDFLSPNDIESINVLKDGASAAIYGSRGANGVVLITTKGGKKNQEGTISYDGYTGVQSTWKQMNLLNGTEYALIANEAAINSGVVPVADFRDPASFGEGTDWQNEIFQTAPIQSHQITISGGSESSAYTVSGNYFNQQGIVGGEKSEFTRYTARANLTHDVKDWFTVGNTLGLTYLTRNALPENNEFNTPLVRALNMDPLTSVYKPDGTFAYSKYAETDITNPVNAIDKTFDTWTTNRVVGSVFALAKIAKGITFKTTYSVDATFAQQDVFLPVFDLSIDTAVGDAPSQEMREQNVVSKTTNNWKNWQWENVLIYTRALDEKQNIEITAGNTVLYNRYDLFNRSSLDLPSNDVEDAFFANTQGLIEDQSHWDYAEESSLLSFFGRVNYDFGDKYVASLTFRADGSSKFGPNNRFGYFPSLSAGWIVSNEDFWKNKAISFLKVRASWGQNGNDNIGIGGFLTTVQSGQNYSFGSGEDITVGSVALKAANPDLKWETSTQSNFGVDLEFWDGKLNATVDLYNKVTSDMLFDPSIPLIVGTEPPIRNIGDMVNNGLELSANYRNYEKELKYSVGGNIAFISTDILALGGDEPISDGALQSVGFVSRTEVGHPLASFYGYVTDGIFQDADEIAAHAFQNENTAPGDIRFKDLNNDGVIDQEDQDYIGNPTPDFTYGITANAEYKGFDLSIFLQGVSGNEIFNGTVRYDFAYANRPQSVLNRWTGPGTSDLEPRVTLIDVNENFRISDRYVESGSYFRIKNFQVGYNVPTALRSKIKSKKIRVYLSAQNLLTITKYSGLDPEIGATAPLAIGIDRGFYPSARIYTGGINITF